MQIKFSSLKKEVRTGCFVNRQVYKAAMLVLCIVCISCYTNAQLPAVQQKSVAIHPHHDHIDPLKDKMEYQGYTIHPIPAPGGGLGYDVFKDHKLIVHRFQNVVMGRPLYKKDDVYKVAKWSIAQYTKTSHFPATVPFNAEAQLHLSSINSIN